MPVGTEPVAVGVQQSSATPGRALVANFGSNTLTPIDLGSMTAGAELSVPGNPTDVTVATDGTAWVTAGGSLVSVAVGAVTTTSPIAVPGLAEAVALEPSGSEAWVALQQGYLVPVQLPGGTVGRTVRVGGRPSDVVISPS